jgi:hypothetical protein
MRDAAQVRTTLEIDDDVLQAAKEIALTRGSTAGKVLSELARKGLVPVRSRVKVRNGVPLLGPRGETDRAVTMDHVNELRDDPA